MPTTAWIDGLRNLLGPDRVVTDELALVRYSYDAWPVAAKWRQQNKQPYRPDVIVHPDDTTDVSRLLAWASEHHVPVTPWGAGSAVTGAPLPMHGGITLDMSAMNRVLALDELNLLVTVQAGTMGYDLEAELNSHGYTLNHSPQSLNRSTVGGWLATRATGQFSSRWGGIEDLAVALTAVLPTGDIVETRLMPRAAIGPDLRHIFIGAEGTLGVITAATLKVFPLADQRLFEAYRFLSIEAGLTAMRKIMRAGLRPFLVRFYDEAESRYAMQDDSFVNCAMFLGFEGTKAVAEAEEAAAEAICRNEGGTALGSASVVAWMNRRFDFSGIERIVEQPGGIAETIEVAHLWDGILPTYRALKQALAPLTTEVWGHFSHVYPQGVSLYIIVFGQAQNAEEAEKGLMDIWEVSMRTCLDQGAAISHHHGIGLARLPYIRAELASAMTVLERIKQALDPGGIMNPGKLGLNTSEH